MVATLLEPARPATLRLALPPEPPAVRAAAQTVRNFLSEQGIAAGELYAYELCVDEAGINAAEYARGSARARDLGVEVLVTATQVELRVTDHTPGFVLSEAIPPPSPWEERGRGLFLIQAAMDEVRYLRGGDENILIMRKKRRAPAPPPAGAVNDSSPWFPPEQFRSQLAEARLAQAQLAGELLLRSETLASVFRCCAELGTDENAANGFGPRLLLDLLHLTSADWYVLRILSPDGRQLAVAAASAPELAAPPLEFPAPPARVPGIELAVATARVPARFDLREGSAPDEPLRSVGRRGTGLVQPLVCGGTLVGTLAVGRRAGDFPLGRLQDEVVRAFAEFMAIHTVNLRRHQLEVRHRVVERELEIAREIQNLLLPRSLPQPEGFCLAGARQSAREVGGDFYDAVAPDDHSLVLLVADVMGKGVPAALFATTMRGLLRSLIERRSEPGQVLAGLNRLLFPELSSVGMHITAQVIHLDLKARRVTAAGAGHCPILFLSAGSGRVSILPTEGLPLGIAAETDYRTTSLVLGSPTALLVHTDGLTDTLNPQGTPFGLPRLKAWMTAALIPGCSAAAARDGLLAELSRFRGEAAMTDDQAFLLLTEEFAGPGPAGRPR